MCVCVVSWGNCDEMSWWRWLLEPQFQMKRQNNGFLQQIALFFRELCRNNAGFICWAEWWHLRVMTFLLISNTHTQTTNASHPLSSCTILTSLTDTSRGPYYHFHHLLKSLSLRKHFSADFHYSSTAQTDTQLQGLLSPQPRQCVLVWQSVVFYTETGRDGEV